MRTFYYVFHFSHTIAGKVFGIVNIYAIEANVPQLVGEVSPIQLNSATFANKLRKNLIDSGIITRKESYSFTSL